MSADIRLIATDLDGTLLDENGEVSPANAEALADAVAAGITVCIATGRSHASASRFARELGIGDSIVISYNGAMVRRVAEDEPLLHVPVDAGLASAIVHHCISERLHLDYFIDDNLYVTHVDYWARLYLARTGDMPIPVGDLRQFDGRTPTKLLVSADPDLVKDLFPREQARWAGKLFVTHSLPEYIEYLNPEATKGSALQWLAAHLQIQMEQVMGMGDQLNDLPMIQSAGIGVAMPGAAERVKEDADYVAASAAEGVAEAIRHYIDI